MKKERLIQEVCERVTVVGTIYTWMNFSKSRRYRQA